MVVDVDLRAEPAVVTLESPEDCAAFSVRARGDGAGLGAALEAAGMGRMDGDEALVEVDAVRRLAAGRVGEGWDADFAAMLRYAEGKGWIADDGRSIRAHVEGP
ncbi:MAG TPA: hypothetical protein VE395_08805 [Acidimicrobiales bacterium]|nr:hypothetical protein [Acidimicrobiales bacterium]